MPAGSESNWVTGSHDMGRVGSRLGDQLIDQMNMLALMLPGLAVTYQGEELGMRDTDISWEETRDPAGCACGPTRYQECSRDPERTPFQVKPPPISSCHPYNYSGAMRPMLGSATDLPPGCLSTQTTHGSTWPVRL